ncbi:MAG: DUF2752 domain-containing protein [Actinomycetota bacterium]
MITTRAPSAHLRGGTLYAIPFVAAVVLATIEPTDGSPTICGFATCTGIACPGCGMARATGHLLRGNVTEALRYHPLVFLVLAELLAAWGIWVAHRAGWIQWRHRRWVDIVIGVTAALLIMVWIVRLATGTTPPV